MDTGAFTRFSQYLQQPLELKQWFTIVEDARAITSQVPGLSYEELYVMPPQEYSLVNPNAGKIMDAFDDVQEMHFHVGNPTSEFEIQLDDQYSFENYRWAPGTFLSIETDRANPFQIDFFAISDTPTLVEDIVSRFYTNNESSHAFIPASSEFQQKVTLNALLYIPVDFKC